MAQHLSRSHVLAGTGAMLAAMARPAHAQAVPKLRLICVPGEGNSPVLYGIRAGMYRRAGIDVEIVPTGSGTTATTAVIGGAYELAGGSVIAALAAHLRNIPIALVCNAGLWDAKSPISYAVVAADSSLHTGADVNGKTGGVAGLNDIIVVGMLAWIDKNGGDSSTVKWVEMPNSAQGPAVIEHRIDFAALTEPNYTANMESGKLRMFAVPLDAIADRFAISGYYARRDWAQNNQQAVRTFTRVTYEAATYTNGHREEMLPMIADVTKIPIEVLRKINHPVMATSSDTALLQPVIDAAAKYKNIPRAFPAAEMYFP